MWFSTPNVKAVGSLETSITNTVLFSPFYRILCSLVVDSIVKYTTKGSDYLFCCLLLIDEVTQLISIYTHSQSVRPYRLMSEYSLHSVAGQTNSLFALINRLHNSHFVTVSLTKYFPLALQNCNERLCYDLQLNNIRTNFGEYSSI